MVWDLSIGSGGHTLLIYRYGKAHMIGHTRPSNKVYPTLKIKIH